MLCAMTLLRSEWSQRRWWCWAPLICGNYEHIVIMATCGQIAGANHRESSPTTKATLHGVPSVYLCHSSSLFSRTLLRTTKLACWQLKIWYFSHSFVVLTLTFEISCSPWAIKSFFQAHLWCVCYVRWLCWKASGHKGVGDAERHRFVVIMSISS